MVDLNWSRLFAKLSNSNQVALRLHLAFALTFRAFETTNLALARLAPSKLDAARMALSDLAKSKYLRVLMGKQTSYLNGPLLNTFKENFANV